MNIEGLYQSKLSVFRNILIEESAKCGPASNVFSGILNSVEKRMGLSDTAQAFANNGIAANISGSNSRSEIESAIQNAAQKTGLDPDLLRSVIRVESSFRPNAESGAGAQGLMQLMPGTAKEVGVTDPFDPYQNVLGGAKYLKKMLNRFGDIRLALAAYNRGPGRIASFNITDPDDPEQYSKLAPGCRSYVSKILEYYNQYKND